MSLSKRFFMYLLQSQKLVEMEERVKSEEAPWSVMGKGPHRLGKPRTHLAS